MTGLKIKPNLVSLVTPCFNVEKYIARYFDSILAQSYKDLELILINDGSTDSTLTIIQDYVPKLEAEGYQCQVIDQKNKGLGGAIDSGLKIFTGEFLTWPDPDDWLTPNSIERRVALLRRHPEAGLLRSNANLVDEESEEVTGQFLPLEQTPHFPDSLLDDLLFLRTFFAPVCHMVQSEFFLKVNPRRSIYYTPHASQNIQMLIPIVARYPTIQTGECLANYWVRSDSRSRKTRSPETLQLRTSTIYDVLMHTAESIESIGQSDIDLLRQFYLRNHFLPREMRGGLKEDGLGHLKMTDFSAAKKGILSGCLKLRCHPVFRRIDDRMIQLLSRGLSRAFVRAANLPGSACRTEANRRSTSPLPL